MQNKNIYNTESRGGQVLPSPSECGMPFAHILKQQALPVILDHTVYIPRISFSGTLTHNHSKKIEYITKVSSFEESEDSLDELAQVWRSCGFCTHARRFPPRLADYVEIYCGLREPH